MERVRLILDPPARGSWNMAVDETLLQSAVNEGIASLRFYRWEEPTLSLGYFQSCEDRQEHLASLRCPLIRRSTGGGAIVHDHELTYSFAMPLRDHVSRRAALLYQTFHLTLVKILRFWGGWSSLCRNCADPRTTKEPFLCFERRATGDVLLGEHKIAGSAQRRRQGAVLQHGSVLLSRSDLAPELPGFQEISGVNLDLQQLISAWVELLSDELSLQIFQQTLTSEELADVNKWETEKFSDQSWTARR